MKKPTFSFVQVSLKRYAPFAGSKNHGKRIDFTMQVDSRHLPALRRMFTDDGAVIGRLTTIA